MRCYLMKFGKIEKIRLLKVVPAALNLLDAEAIKEAAILFSGFRDEADGFEIWERERFVYRHPLPMAI
jgi:hypothetical protein